MNAGIECLLQAVAEEETKENWEKELSGVLKQFFANEIIDVKKIKDVKKRARKNARLLIKRNGGKNMSIERLTIFAKQFRSLQQLYVDEYLNMLKKEKNNLNDHSKCLCNEVNESLEGDKTKEENTKVYTPFFYAAFSNANKNNIIYQPDILNIKLTENNTRYK